MKECVESGRFGNKIVDGASVRIIYLLITASQGCATGSHGDRLLVDTMIVYSQNSTYYCTISTYVIGERSICGYLHKT